MADVLASFNWPSNAHMIAEVARLGYLDGAVLDATYGEGGFWTVWQPEVLVTNDLYKPADYAWDYLKPFPPEARGFDAFVFDPPYKLSGTPALGEFDARYGIEEAGVRWQDKMEWIERGAFNCYHATERYLLVKCQDQVCSGKVRWQTDVITRVLEDVGARKVDRFDYVILSPRPQPGNRRQVTARRNSSTLLVFEKGKK